MKELQLLEATEQARGIKLVKDGVVLEQELPFNADVERNAEFLFATHTVCRC
jgi:hypothetical protein